MLGRRISVVTGGLVFAVGAVVVAASGTVFALRSLPRGTGERPADVPGVLLLSYGWRPGRLSGAGGAHRVRRRPARVTGAGRGRWG
ncbi:hypothetical protein ACH4U5_33535 [Streptomyces sp. NPDC020858]|uniref:hypothetical protein n=1 Tax=Streptomyces sp. NPDC020858 TaxID=3365097 RepID=UPI0037A36128